MSEHETVDVLLRIERELQELNARVRDMETLDQQGQAILRVLDEINARERDKAAMK